MQIKRLQGQEEKKKGIYYEYDADDSPIGEGGMGVVYKGFCVDEKTNVRKEVAIKALHEDLPDEVYARAEREASIQLRHENLVEMLGLITVYEKNRWGELVNHHYVISEYLYGVELSDLLEGRFDHDDDFISGYIRQLYDEYENAREETSIKIMKAILSGVLALHDKGYIHRDIDPSNIMVTKDGTIKLIDFGIAKNLNTLTTKDKLTTTSGQFMGKAEYASPELVLGDVKHQNFTTDIYALGVLMYRLLVGTLPFMGSQYEILQQQMKKKVPVKNVKNKVLADIVKKATMKNQCNRYGSVAEFRVAIDNAECYKKNGNRTIAGCLFALVIIMGIGIKLFWPAADTLSTKSAFENALFLLDASSADSVRIGFKEMEKLAYQGNDSAKIEMGVTYFSLKISDVDLRSKLILNRRTHLNLKVNDSLELRKTFSYISDVKNKSLLTPEIYYLLGYASYYEKSSDSLCLHYFNEALELLKKDSTCVSHGYEYNDLKHRLEVNIKQLRNSIADYE